MGIGYLVWVRSAQGGLCVGDGSSDRLLWEGYTVAPVPGEVAVEGSKRGGSERAAARPQGKGVECRAQASVWLRAHGPFGGTNVMRLCLRRRSVSKAAAIYAEILVSSEEPITRETRGPFLPSLLRL